MSAANALPGETPRMPRAALHRLTGAHAAQLLPLLDDWQVVRMLSEVPWPLTPADVKTYAARQGAPDSQTEDFAIIVGSRAAGVCAVKKPGSGNPPRTMPRLGYWLGRPYWGLGYATEAVGILVRRAFDHFPHDVVGAGVFVDNSASRRVLAKLGFLEAGRGATQSLSRGVAVPTIDMQLTRERWRATSPERS